MDRSEGKAGADRRRQDERERDQFWRELKPQREPLDRRWFLPTLMALVTLASPWYLPNAWAMQMIGGLPLWVWIALLGALGLAGFVSTSALLLWRDTDDVDDHR